MSPITRTRRSDVSSALAASRLGVPAVVFFVMSAAAPLTVIAGAVTTAHAVTGVVGIPVAFLAVAVVLALFSVGYVAMARHISHAGAFYTYITHGLGRPAGVAASFVAVLAYNGLQIALYGGLGVAAAGLAQAELDTDLPWWTFALIAWLIVAVLGVLRVDLNGKVLAVLLCAEIAVVVVYDVAEVAHPAGGVVSLAALDPANLLAAGIGAVLVTAVTGFIGFESAAVFSEESRNPRRTVPSATYLAVALIAVLYAGSSWAMTVAVGPDAIVAASREQGPALIFGLAAVHLGQTMADAGQVLFLTSLLAALLSFHNTVARYLFALGREGVLPRGLGHTVRRSGAPKNASLTQSLLGLSVIAGFAVTGWDPLVQLFFWGGMTGGFGTLLLIATTSLAVIAYFSRHRFTENAWRRTIAPALASIALAAVIAVALANFAILLGVDAHDPRRWILPAVYPVAAVAGFVWALYLRRRNPAVYAAIGLGANAVTGRATHTDAPPEAAAPTASAPTGAHQ
jgi:amino acid transporter